MTDAVLAEPPAVPPEEPVPSEAPRWSSRAQLTAWLIVVVGALLRLRQYAVDRSLWRDEAALVYNVLHRGYLGFSHPLAFEQGTPPGFFMAEKAMSQLFGSSELSLRALPLVCGIAALAVALVLARRHLEASTGLVALALMAVSPSLIYFASEVKQYSPDVLVGLLLLLAASSAWRRGLDRRSCAVLAVAGCLGILCSYAALFVLVGVGVTLGVAVLRRRDRTLIVRLALVGAAWVAAFVALYALFDRHLNSDQYLKSFWHDAFLSIPPTDAASLHRWGSALATLLSMLDGRPELVWLVGPLAAVGLVHLVRRQPGVTAVLLVPWVTVVVASSFQLYPATERLVLFLLPALAVLVGAGTSVVASWIAERVELGGIAFACLVVVLCSAVGLNRLVSPQPVEELRPLLADLRAHLQPGDAVYVSDTAGPAYLYYDSRSPIRASRTVLGRATIADTRRLADEAQSMARSRRVWLVTSAYWQATGRITPAVTAAFDRIGSRVAQYDGPGASVILYQVPAGT